MSLIVSSANASATPVHAVSRASVQAYARDLGSLYAYEPDLAGVTVAILGVDQSRLRYEQRRVEGRMEFRFKDGTLQLTLRQRIYVADDAGDCEREIWEHHEREHVADNAALLPQLEGAIRRNAVLNRILVNPIWRPIEQYRATQAAIESGVGDIFKNLSAVAAARRDTPAEYLHIRRQVHTGCT